MTEVTGAGANFANPEIGIGELPCADAVAFQPVSPKLATHRIMGQSVAVFILMAASTIAIPILDIVGQVDLPPLGWWLGGLALLWVLGMLWARLDARAKGYALRAHDLLYRSGILWRKEIAIPFNRIQHVETHHGPIERALGIASLLVYTAGAAHADARLPGLPRDEADRLHEFILSHAESTDDEP